MLEKSFNAGSIKYMTVMKRWIMIRNSPWPLSQCPTQALKASFSLPLGWRLEVGTGRAGMDEGRRSIFWAPFVPEPGWGAQDSRLFTICFTIFFFLLNLFFIWRTIALQYYVGFCHTTTWISHNYISILSLWNLPPHPIHPSRSSQRGLLCYIAASH